MMEAVEHRPRRRPGRPPVPLEDRKEAVRCNLLADQWQRVREEAFRRDVSFSSIVREALDMWTRSL